MAPSLARPAREIGDILRRHGPAYRQRHPLTADQAKVLRRLAACRTAELGGHVDGCDACGFARVSYNSCRMQRQRRQAGDAGRPPAPAGWPRPCGKAGRRGGVGCAGSADRGGPAR